jgi:magnesium transporter
MAAGICRTYSDEKPVQARRIQNMERQNFVNEEITAEILELIRGHMGAPGFQDLLSDYHEYDIAQAAEQLTREERILFYKSIDLDWAAEIFAYYSDAQGMLLELSPKQAAEILERMDADEAVEALDGIDPEFRKAAAGYLS